MYFIVGTDVLPDFHRWHQPERVLELCRLAVVGRPGRRDSDNDDDGISALAARFPQAVGAGAIVRTPASPVDLSASELRRALSEGQSVRYRIPDAVASYIAEQRLYRQETDTDGGKL